MKLSFIIFIHFMQILVIFSLKSGQPTLLKKDSQITNSTIYNGNVNHNKTFDFRLTYSDVKEIYKKVYNLNKEVDLLKIKLMKINEYSKDNITVLSSTNEKVFNFK